MNKNLITVKSFFEYIYSDENTDGVIISEKAIDGMNDTIFKNLEKLLLDVKILPCHCVYNYEKLGIDSDIKTENLTLVKFIASKVYH